MPERYVLLGLARARSAWFSEVARWSNAAAIPAEFVKCISPEETRARLASGRPFSAALLDGSLPGVDRDLIDAVREVGSVPIVVEERAGGRDWAGLGVPVVLPAPFDRQQLLDALSLHARPIASASPVAGAQHAAGEPVGAAGVTVVVTGPGGGGSSTAAIALAQGLASGAGGVRGAGKDGKAGKASPVGRVLLADLCLSADQAMLHDARDVVPGVQELVESHRTGQPAATDLLDLTFDVRDRGYRLLLGLRRPRFWGAIRPRAFRAALDTLRHAFDVVVCDVTPDLEGEDAGGSLEVEDRNIMARTAVQRADLVFVVARPGLKGTLDLVRITSEVLELGMDPSRIVPVLNAAPRNPRQRAEMSAALAELQSTSTAAAGAVASPLFLPDRRVEEALRDGVVLPAPLPELMAGAYRAVLQRAQVAPPVPAPPRRPAEPVPVPVRPGSLGTWTTGTPGASEHP
jgi:Mrp family chromosome partitioning ATPase